MSLKKFTSLTLSTLVLCLASSSCSKESNQQKETGGAPEHFVEKASRVGRIASLIQNGSQTIKVSDFDLSQMDDQAIASLYLELYQNRSKHSLYAKLAFEAKDWMIRRSHSDAQAFSYFKGLAGLPFIQDLDFERDSFKPVNTLRVTPREKDDNILVLHASLEAPNARVGGIAEYLSGLVKAEHAQPESGRGRQINGRLLTPFYDFLKSKLLDSAKFAGFVEHIVDGAIRRSSVYEFEENNVIQYLVQPDMTYRFSNENEILRGWEIFDVIQQTQLYSVVQNQAGWIYFASAAASVAACYGSETRNKNVDVLHLNGQNMALTAPILNTQLNRERQLAGLAKIGILSTIHDTSESEINFRSELFGRVDLPIPSSSSVNLQILMSSYSHMTNIVSKTMAMEVTRPGFWQNDRLGDLLKDLQTQGRFQGINNGIFFGSFDITREDVLGSLRVAQDYSNYAEKKQEAKKVLFNSGIIGSDTRPLFVYVGRYSREKGIDVLPEFARYIVARGGQIAIMGVLSGGPISPVILELVSMSRDPQYQGLIRVFTSFARDQLALLNSVGVSKGKVIRFASDFTLVPSIMEAAGLVPIEGLSMGSATISSYRQGLKDQCRRPLHFANSDGDIHDIHTFTCVPFERVNDNLRLTLRNLFNRTDAALNEWNELSQHERTEIQINLIREAKKFDWSQEGGALDEYRALYEKARKALP